MKYSIPIKENMVATSSTEAISKKSAVEVSRKIKKMKLNNAKKFLEAIIEMKASINGKFYSSTTEKILELLKSAENNAITKGFEPENLWIKSISASKGATRSRRRRSRNFGIGMKSTNLQIILEHNEKIKKETEKKSKPEKVKEKSKEVEKEKKAEKKEIKAESKEELKK